MIFGTWSCVWTCIVLEKKFDLLWVKVAKTGLGSWKYLKIKSNQMSWPNKYLKINLQNLIQNLWSNANLNFGFTFVLLSCEHGYPWLWVYTNVNWDANAEQPKFISFGVGGSCTRCVFACIEMHMPSAKLLLSCGFCMWYRCELRLKCITAKSYKLSCG